MKLINKSIQIILIGIKMLFKHYQYADIVSRSKIFSLHPQLLKKFLLHPPLFSLRHIPAYHCLPSCEYRHERKTNLCNKRKRERKLNLTCTSFRIRRINVCGRHCGNSRNIYLLGLKFHDKFCKICVFFLLKIIRKAFYTNQTEQSFPIDL